MPKVEGFPDLEPLLKHLRFPPREQFEVHGIEALDDSHITLIYGASAVPVHRANLNTVIAMLTDFRDKDRS